MVTYPPRCVINFPSRPFFCWACVTVPYILASKTQVYASSSDILCVGSGTIPTQSCGSVPGHGVTKTTSLVGTDQGCQSIGYCHYTLTLTVSINNTNNEWLQGLCNLYFTKNSLMYFKKYVK